MCSPEGVAGGGLLQSVASARHGGAQQLGASTAQSQPVATERAEPLAIGAPTFTNNQAEAPAISAEDIGAPTLAKKQAAAPPANIAGVFAPGARGSSSYVVGG